jgi:hypothetical protein
MHCFRWLEILTLVLIFAGIPAIAQRPVQPPPPSSEAQTELDREMQQKVQLEQQRKRFEQMKRDSQKLLELATELKQYVDQAGEHVLSLDVLRKAEEMEKLARRVKENMRAN